MKWLFAIIHCAAGFVNSYGRLVTIRGLRLCGDVGVMDALPELGSRRRDDSGKPRCGCKQSLAGTSTGGLSSRRSVGTVRRRAGHRRLVKSEAMEAQGPAGSWPPGVSIQGFNTDNDVDVPARRACSAAREGASMTQIGKPQGRDCRSEPKGVLSVYLSCGVRFDPSLAQAAGDNKCPQRTLGAAIVATLAALTTVSRFHHIPLRGASRLAFSSTAAAKSCWRP